MAPGLEDLSLGRRQLFDRWVRGSGGTPPPAVAGSPGERGPLSPGQERIWFAERMDPGSPLHNLSTRIRLRGRLDPSALDGALDGVVARHGALRTAIVEEPDGQPVQHVLAHRHRALPVLDLSGEADPERAADDVERTQTATPFDLAEGRPLRARLVRLAAHDHVLVLTVHHIVVDAWSGRLVLEEIGSRYRAATTGHGAPAGGPPPSHVALARRQRDEGAAAHAADLAYWRWQLAGAPATLDVVHDRPRRRPDDRASGTSTFAVGRDLVDRLEAAAVRARTTPFVVVLAALQIVLARWSGRRDVLVGVAVTGRTRRELRDVVGFLVNTVVVRGAVGGPVSFGEVVESTRRATTEAYAHQSMPFERLVSRLGGERAPGRHPVFQVGATWQDRRAGAPDFGDLEVEVTPLPACATMFDLRLVMTRGRDDLQGDLEFASGLFDDDTARRFADQVLRTLAAGLADTGRRIDTLEPPQEERALTRRWGRGTRPGAVTAVPDLVAARAAERGEAVAIDGADGRLTRSALAEAVDLLTRRLRAAGAGPDVPVAVCLHRTGELVSAMLAVLAAGAAYVPIDPSTPRERMRQMLAEVGVTLAVSRRRHTDLVDLVPEVVLLDGCPEAPPPAPPPAPSPQPEHLAYVIHTSGSTGHPKAVGVVRRAMAEVLRHFVSVFDVGPDDVLCAIASTAFDGSVPELFGSLVAGARLVVATEDEARDPARLDALLQRSGATVLLATPTTWRLLVEAGWTGAGLRLALSAGEPLAEHLAAELRTRVREVHNVYGPTEATVWSTTWRSVGEEHPVPIGVPAGSVTLRVVDAALGSCPIGVPGELVVGGSGVARGYLGRPGLTAERFVPDPEGEPGARAYRTGDRVVWRRDGVLLHLGRTDDQVKVRGQRVEPAEIEQVLRECDGVADAAVGVERGGDRQTGLHGYLVPAAGPVDGSEVRAALAHRLPAAMIPARFTEVERLPVTFGGKLDRGALPALPGRPLATGTPSSGPETAVERVVARVWCTVLDVARVGRHDSFFDLGGHSILLPRVQRELVAALGRPVRVVELFEHPTLRALATHLDTASGGPVEAGHDRAAGGPPRRGEQRRRAARRIGGRRSDDGGGEHR